MKEVQIHTAFITLGQLLKLADAVSAGSEAKQVITDGLVQVNGEVDTRRGRKLYPNDKITYANMTYLITK